MRCKDYESKIFHGTLTDWCKQLKDIVCCQGFKKRCWLDKRSTGEKLEEIRELNSSKRVVVKKSYQYNSSKKVVSRKGYTRTGTKTERKVKPYSKVNDLSLEIRKEMIKKRFAGESYDKICRWLYIDNGIYLSMQTVVRWFKSPHTLK